MKKKIRTLVPILMVLAVLASLTVSLAGCDDSDTIVIGRAQWNYDIIQINIIAKAIETKGYDIRISDIYEMGLMYAAVADGSVDFFADAWLPTMQESYLEANKDRLVVGGDLYGVDVPLCWAIPGYTADQHGITSLEDLKGKADLFGGKIYGYEAGSGGTERSLAALEEYDLADEYEFVTGSVPALIAELRANMQLNRPVMVVLWRPHPIFTQLDVRMLEDPKNVFGTNYVRYIANVQFAQVNPEIKAFLDNVLIPLEDMEAMMLENEEQGVSEEALAERWFDDHKAAIDTWWP